MHSSEIERWRDPPYNPGALPPDTQKATTAGRDSRKTHPYRGKRSSPVMSVSVAMETREARGQSTVGVPERRHNSRAGLVLLAISVVRCRAILRDRTLSRVVSWA